MKRNILTLAMTLAAALWLSPTAVAQDDGARVTNMSLNAKRLSDVKVPTRQTDMFFFDGRLRLVTEGMLFVAVERDGTLYEPEIDTALLAIDSKMEYVVRHKETGRLYFTKRDSKGCSGLYEYYEKKPGRYAARRVKPAGFSSAIEHPVFSSDGRVMIFSSDCPLGVGGRDLWYSEWSDGEWMFPQNLGWRVNSEGDEVTPAIVGDFLVFSSDGRGDSRGGSDLYATRLVADEQTGDTVMMYPIGMCPVASLEAPFCSADNDLSLVVNEEGTCGWWLRSDTAGGDAVYSFSGLLRCVGLRGVVRDAGGRGLKDARIVVRQDGCRDVVVEAGGDGSYALFLQPGVEYELVFSAPEHFAYRQTVVAERGDEKKIYYYESYDVELGSFVVDSAYRFNDLFASSVGSELSAKGREWMATVARFLADNPGMRLRVVSDFRESADIPFCTLLNNARLRALTDFLVGEGVPRASVVTAAGLREAEPDRADKAMLSAAAVSSRTVTFTFLR